MYIIQSVRDYLRMVSTVIVHVCMYSVKEQMHFPMFIVVARKIQVLFVLHLIKDVMTKRAHHNTHSQVCLYMCIL